MKNKDLPIGTKVWLSPESEWAEEGGSNPVGVQGIVGGSRDGWVNVDWSDGTCNAYEDDDWDFILDSEVEATIPPNFTKREYINCAKELFGHLVNEDQITPEMVATIFENERISQMFVVFLFGKGYTKQEIEECEKREITDTLEFIQDNWE